jgi:hypothetical protein
VPIQAAIEADRFGERLDSFIRAARETPTPGLLAHDWPFIWLARNSKWIFYDKRAWPQKSTKYAKINNKTSLLA